MKLRPRALFSPSLQVEGLGAARHLPRGGVNYTVELVIDDVQPRNGSRVGGTELTITGSGFARLGTMNKVLVDGVSCVPKTVKNFGCRFSEDDSGYPCAYTTPGMGYEMVASPYDENYASPEAANLK